jgi:hypothetical protein
MMIGAIQLTMPKTCDIIIHSETKIQWHITTYLILILRRSNGLFSVKISGASNLEY